MRGALLSDEEKARIRTLRSEGVSYSRIAMDLNQNYTLYNGGTRTKNTIKSFVRSDSGEVVRQIRLSKPLLDLAENVGIEVSSESLSEMVTESIARRIKAEV